LRGSSGFAKSLKLFVSVNPRQAYKIYSILPWQKKHTPPDGILVSSLLLEDDNAG
jgi:hypothetical protein